ncbi:hypothetical protein BJV74DRAFT_160645 [Russula compacta]|nr:hypothetical protein BJV74DRAFT_160645 [Russula compacta]
MMCALGTAKRHQWPKRVPVAPRTRAMRHVNNDIAVFLASPFCVLFHILVQASGTSVHRLLDMAVSVTYSLFRFMLSAFVIRPASSCLCFSKCKCVSRRTTGRLLLHGPTNDPHKLFTQNRRFCVRRHLGTSDLAPACAEDVDQ